MRVAFGPVLPVLLLLYLGGCAAPAPRAGAPPAEVAVAVVGTSDLHGHVEPTVFTVTDAAGQQREVARGGLALLGGYLANLRRRMPVVLLDGGDLFQGTLVSNLGEGQVVIDAYNVVGYTAAAVGNHEFDYGPVGPRAVPRSGSDDDPRGALKARIAAARFPFLTANVIDEVTGRPVAWPNTFPSRLVEVPGAPGLRLGLVGGTAEDTPRSTNPMNLRGLRIVRIAPAVRAEAEALRRQGAAAVILTVHEGADCKSFVDPRDLRSCANVDQRVLGIARELQGAVDAVVGGHSHAGVAHFVGDVPVIQAFMGGRYFGRVDLTFRRRDGRYVLDRTRTRMHPPTELCAVEAPPPVLDGSRGRPATCDREHLAGRALAPARYEGEEVRPSAAVQAALQPHLARAAARRTAPIGVELPRRLGRSYRAESELGLVLADLIREGAAAATGQPVDVAFQNGGGIRSELPVGALRYGDLYEVLPFDNRLALIRMPAGALAELLRRNMEGSGGVLVPSGLSAEARCVGGRLQLDLYDDSGRPMDPSRSYTVAVSDFLAAGGDNFGAVLGQLPPGAVTYYDDLPPLRELVLQALKGRKRLEPPPGGAPRLRLPGPRPVRCAGEAGTG